MKKSMILAAAAITALGACDNEIEVSPIKEVKAPVFTATIKGQTKTQLTDGSADDKKSVQWLDTDQVIVNGVTYSVAPGADVTTANLTKANTEAADPASPYTAYYPSYLYSATAGQINLPASYTYEEGKFNMPMYAKSENTTLAFKNICGVLAITVSITDFSSVSSITVEADHQLNGAFAITDSTWALTAQGEGTAAEKTVTVNCGNIEIPSDGNGGGSKTFYVSIPPQTYGSLQFVVNGEKNSESVTKTTTTKAASITIERNKIYNIAFAFIYDYVVDSQINYLTSCVAGNGMIDFRPNTGRYNPYFSAYAALGLLTKPTSDNISIVKGYLAWIFDHLNGNTNPQGDSEIPGSIYDYSFNGVEETTDGTYDSIDSYTSLVLIVCAEMVRVSPSTKDWLQTKKDKIALVASALVACIDTPIVSVPGMDDDDYLSIAHLGYAIKYLMDNCEVYRGLCSAAFLKANGLLEDSVDYEAYATNNQTGIETQLWRDEMYSYYDNNMSNCNSNWNTFYADAVAQLTPVAMGVIDPSSERATSLYNEFNSHYTSWQEGITAVTFPWVFVCYAAACMGDKARVNTYIEHIYSINVRGEQKDQWFNQESGFMLLAIDKIRNN